MAYSDAGSIKIVIREFLTERFDIPSEQIRDDSSLRDLGLDSMLLLDIMLEMENRLNVKLKDLAMPANPSLQDVAALIERNMAAGA